MKQKASNPHAWFFNYVTGLEGYNKDFEKVIREGIIMEFTNGLTGSLSELHTSYPDLYRKMKSQLLQQQTYELDQARKRLIAALFSYLKNEKPSLEYVKAVACNAAKVDRFNDISLAKLKSLYRIFGTKNTKELSDSHRKLVWEAMRMENRN